MMIRNVLVFTLLFISVIVGNLSLASAVKGIGIAPGLKEIELHEEQRDVSFEVTVSNSTDSRADFRLSTVDFGALDESGGVAFVGRSGQEAYAYSLSQWMKLDRSNISVEPGKTEVVKVTIVNNDNLSPGGHYGAVLATSRSDDQFRGDSVAMLPGASTLVLLKKLGGEKYSLDIDSIKANKSFFDVSRQASIRFHNKGNVHAVPRGTIELSGTFGGVLARGVINEASSYVLPETYRQIDVPLRFSKQPWLPGRYTMEVTWRYDGTDSVRVETLQQWYLGRLGGVLLLTLGSIFVLYMFIVHKRRPVTRN